MSKEYENSTSPEDNGWPLRDSAPASVNAAAPALGFLWEAKAVGVCESAGQCVANGTVGE